MLGRGQGRPRASRNWRAELTWTSEAANTAKMLKMRALTAASKVSQLESLAIARPPAVTAPM